MMVVFRYAGEKVIETKAADFEEAKRLAGELQMALERREWRAIRRAANGEVVAWDDGYQTVVEIV